MFNIMSKIKPNFNEHNNEFENQINDESNLNVNIIIAVFQEKLSQLMTEVVIKDATIRQQANLINTLKGNKKNE